MLHFLPGALLGVIAILLFVINIIICAIILFSMALVMYIVPNKRWCLWWHDKLHLVPELWNYVSRFILKLICRIEWDVQGVDELNPKGWYLMLSNHQTWSDIIVLQQVFFGHIPPLRFFMKNELKWQLPIAAQACMLLDYPFMKRHSKEYLQKHPEMKGKDIATTRKSCEKFKYIPTTIINFVEGGRFSTDRHANQKSPYKHLLKPKAGGIAFSIATMGEFIHTILDVTIVYPNEDLTFWDFVCGRINKVIVKVRKIPITPDLIGDYEDDRAFRVHFQSWVNQVWHDKDKLIEEIKIGAVSHGPKG
jgi:1-acyl-sn-glycerol-3-phosphate acyltransferase